MKAVRIHALGGIDALRHEDCEDPLLEEPADATVKLLAAAVNRVDLVVDCIGGRDWGNSLACLARCGRLVTCGAVAGANPPTDLRRVFWNQLKVCGATHPTRDEFRQLLKFFEYSRVKPIIDTVYSLREAAQAHRRMEQRRQFRKIVLRTDS